MKPENDKAAAKEAEAALKAVKEAMAKMNRATRANARDDSYVTRTSLDRAFDAWMAAKKKAESLGLEVREEWDH